MPGANESALRRNAKGGKGTTGSQEYASHSQMSEEQDFSRASAAAEDETERGEKLQPMVSFTKMTF